MEGRRSNNRFVIDFGDIELPPEAAKVIETSVQKAALDAIAQLDFDGDISFKIPREWLGIWVEGRFVGLRQLPRGF